MLRRQSGDQPQDGALAAAAGSQDADELALVRQVLDEEGDVANGRELVRLPGVVGLRHVAEIDDAAEGRTPLGRWKRLTTCPMPTGVGTAAGSGFC